MEKINKKNCFDKECKLLNLLTCPYIGIYSYNYEFLIPSAILQTTQITNKIFSNFPSQVQKIFNEYKRKPSEFMVINADISEITTKHFSSGNNLNLKRFNMVTHPSVFYNLEYLEKDHNTKVVNAIYTFNQYDLVRETQESVFFY